MRVLMLLTLGLVGQLEAQDVLYKCVAPEEPLRFAKSEEAKAEQTPPCEDWGEIRAPGLVAIVDGVGDQRFSAANVFLARAGDLGDFSYPVTEAGIPVTTSRLYQTPEEFGFRATSIESAALGSMVIYDGLGGILVEFRASEEHPWSRQVLYPSAAREFELAVADLSIPGELPPRVLVQGGAPIT